MTSTLPPPAEQVRFLEQLQRLFSDGSFAATYKLALLHALADLAVLRGADTGEELRVSTREIAEQMLELYWRQALPFPAPLTNQSLVLKQNTGRQAAILTRISEVQAEHGSSLVRLRQRPEAWGALVKEVDQVLRKMPLWRLQTVGAEQLDFIYENRGHGTEITLRPGVAYCLRAFHGLILDLVRGAWLRYVRTYNQDVLGPSSDLAAFLFGAGRASLASYQPILVELQEGRCFYCRKELCGAGAVDHFVPWARYPVDLGHNFVLAHGSCNGAKSDHLAAEPHLERWLERNEIHTGLLERELAAIGVSSERGASIQVARWAYSHTARIGSQVWEKKKHFHPLSPGWEALFPAPADSDFLHGRP